MIFYRNYILKCDVQGGFWAECGLMTSVFLISWLELCAQVVVGCLRLVYYLWVIFSSSVQTDFTKAFQSPSLLLSTVTLFLWDHQPLHFLYYPLTHPYILLHTLSHTHHLLSLRRHALHNGEQSGLGNDGHL